MHIIDWKTPPEGFNPKDLTPPELPDKIGKIIALALDVAGECNIACRYCQERASQPKRNPMSIETLEKTWRFLFPKGPQPNNNYSFHLGSGEPLLNFPVLQRLRELVDNALTDKEIDIRVYLTTNATVIDDALIDWLVDSGWYVKISIDGPAHIHDKWRPFPGGKGTYAHVERVVKEMVKRMPERLQASTVLSPGTDPQEVFTAFEELGIKRIEMVPIVAKKSSLRLNPEDIERFRAFIMNYAKRYLVEDLPEPPPMFSRFGQYIRRLMGYQLAGASCAAARYYLGVGPTGEFYPCTHFVDIEGYRLGHIDSGMDEEAILSFQSDGGRAYWLREPCKECWGAALCTGPCFANSEIFDEEKKPLDYQCDYALATAEAAIFLYNQLRENDLERLLMFLTIKEDIF